MGHKEKYFKFISRCRNRILPEGIYTEEHHIWPRAEKGSNEYWNIINLSYPEHCYAHLLASKIWKSQAYAAFKMVNAIGRKITSDALEEEILQLIFPEYGLEKKNILIYELQSAKDKAREYLSDYWKELWANPASVFNTIGYRDKMKKSCLMAMNNERKEKNRKNAKKQWENKEYQNMMRDRAFGKNNPNFNSIEYLFVNKNDGSAFVGNSYRLRNTFSLDQGSISRLVQGKRKSVKGWHCFGEYSINAA